MPSVTDPTLSSPKDDAQYSSNAVGDNREAGAADGKPGEQVLTLERRAQNGQSSIVGTLTVRHAPQKPAPMSLTEMMLQLSNLADTLQGERVKISDGMIENNKDLIERRSEDRQKMFDKIEHMQKKMKRQQKSAETWGWIGAAAGALITAASMGSLGPVAASCMILSTGIGLGNQIATSAGAYDELAKSDPTAAKVLNYSMFALQIALSLGGFAAAAKSGAAVLEGGEELAKGGANAASDASKAASGASKAANVANEAAEASGKAGSAMSQASSGQQMADDLVQGVSDASRAMAGGQGAADEAVDAGQVAANSANGASSGAANSVDGASSGAAKGANAGGNPAGAENIEKANTLAENASRVGHVMRAVTTGKQTADKIDIAMLSSRSIRTNADLQQVNRDLSVQRSILNEVVERLSDQVAQTKDATKAAMETQNKVYNANMAVAGNIGANTAQAV
ncbi:MAG: hypothetical protein AAF936_08755 [Pseudomonadota bacterium]